MESTGALLAFAVALAGVAITAVFFGLRQLRSPGTSPQPQRSAAGSERATAPRSEPARAEPPPAATSSPPLEGYAAWSRTQASTPPADADSPPLEGFAAWSRGRSEPGALQVVAYKRKLPVTIIVPAALLALGHLPWLIGIFAGIAILAPPVHWSLLEIVLAILPYVLAFGLLEGYRWAWWAVMIRSMKAFVDLVWLSIAWSAGHELLGAEAMEEVAQTPEWLQQAIVLVAWLYHLGVIVPLFTPPARDWCLRQGGSYQ